MVVDWLMIAGSLLVGLLVFGWFVGSWLAGDWLAGAGWYFFYTGTHSVAQGGIELTVVPFCSLLSNWHYKHQTVHQGSCLF